MKRGREEGRGPGQRVKQLLPLPLHIGLGQREAQVNLELLFNHAEQRSLFFSLEAAWQAVGANWSRLPMHVVNWHQPNIAVVASILALLKQGLEHKQLCKVGASWVHFVAARPAGSLLAHGCRCISCQLSTGIGSLEHACCLQGCQCLHSTGNLCTCSHEQACCMQALQQQSVAPGAQTHTSMMPSTNVAHGL